MGQSQSEPIPPEPNPLTNDLWRKTPKWSEDRERALVSEMQKQNTKVKLNLITVGPIGEGKSSLINSFISIAKGRKCAVAEPGKTPTSHTIALKIFPAKGDLEGYLKWCRLMDMMGFEYEDGKGFHPDDFTALLKGNIMNGYIFNPIKPISEGDPYWRKSPTIGHEVHCVIFVARANAIKALGGSHGYRIKQLQEKNTRKGIPRILVLTHVDCVCDEVRRDIKELFSSRNVKEAVKIASEVFGMEPASIHPVKNYTEDYELDPYTNIPLLLAIRQAIHYAQDRVKERT